MDSAKKYGGTLTSDWFGNVQRRPTTNSMLVTRESAVFMKSVDPTNHMAEGARKNAPYLIEQISIVIGELQVTMDGANKACRPIIKAEFAGTRCGARARRHTMRHAWRRNAILEHASPVLRSGLGKIGQPGDPEIAPRSARARPGALGGARRAAQNLPGGVGRGALVSAHAYARARTHTHTHTHTTGSRRP